MFACGGPGRKGGKKSTSTSVTCPGVWMIRRSGFSHQPAELVERTAGGGEGGDEERQTRGVPLR